MKIRIRLIILNFLEFAVWGAWLISLGAYLGGSLHFSGFQIGSFFATMGIASLFMPTLAGIVADKWISAQKVLGICHFFSGVFMILASFMTSYFSLYFSILLAVCFYMPTISLTYAVSYNAMEIEGKDKVKEFPAIRVWGTVGFIISMIAVDLAGFSVNSGQLIFSAVLSFVLGVYSFTLPDCPVEKNFRRVNWIQRFGLDSFSLFKNRNLAIFLIFSMLLGISLQITNAFANDYLTNYFGNINRYKDTFGVSHANILISLSQISEAACILLIPFFLKRFGIKTVMLISMVAWVLRFGLLGTGNPGNGVWMLVLSMIIYGVAFDFFNISGSLYIENNTDNKVRSSAQGLFLLMTNGFGALVGSYLAGMVVSCLGWPSSWFVFSAYSLVVAVLFAVMFKKNC